jgi:hypothetical protein
MKKTSLVLITILTSTNIALVTAADDVLTLPLHVTDVRQSVVLEFSFQRNEAPLCNATVIVQPDHLNIIFTNAAFKGGAVEKEVLTKLRRLINEQRPDLATIPFKDWTYRP